MNATVKTTHAVTTMHPTLEDGDARIWFTSRQEAEQDRFHAGEDIGDTGQVGDHVVAVEAQERQELMEHFKLQQQDDRDQHLEVCQQINAKRREHEKGIEVDTAEIGAKTPTLA